jgi:hypothetical protein
MNSTVFACPSFFENCCCASPEEFESTYIKKVLEIIKKCSSAKIAIRAIEETIERYKANAPWDKMSDQVWKSYILDWKQTIFPFFERMMLRVNGESDNPKKCLENGSILLIEMKKWGYLLNNIDLVIDVDSNYLVITNDSCSDDSCVSIVRLKSDFKVIYLLYPWLNRYDPNLPVAGEYPFIPPDNWMKVGTIKKGKQNGYIDKVKNEWVPDKERKNHWDVQLHDGTHVNVSYEGRII